LAVAKKLIASCFTSSGQASARAVGPNTLREDGQKLFTPVLTGTSSMFSNCRVLLCQVWLSQPVFIFYPGVDGYSLCGADEAQLVARKEVFEKPKAGYRDYHGSSG